MFWTITNGKYRIVGKNVLNNFQDIVVTLGTTTSVANIAMGDILMKEKPSMISHDLKFSIPIVESSFINLCDFSDENNLSPLNVVVLAFMNLQVDEE